jgi:hypothetical protein
LPGSSQNTDEINLNQESLIALATNGYLGIKAVEEIMAVSERFELSMRLPPYYLSRCGVPYFDHFSEAAQSVAYSQVYP